MEKQLGIQVTLREHEISIVNEPFGAVSDMGIANRQKTVLNDTAVIKKAVSVAKKELTDKEMQYYDLLMGDADINIEGTALAAAIPSVGSV